MLSITTEGVDPETTNSLLEARGPKANDGIPPQVLNWRCPGPPAAAGIEAQPCTSQPGTKSAQPVYVHRRGPFQGMCFCHDCHRKLERRECAILRDMSNNGLLEADEELQERLLELERRVIQHQLRDEVARENVDVQANRLKNRWQRADNEVDDEAARENRRKRQRTKDDKQRAKGKKKARGKTRYFRRSEVYPAPFQALLTRAATLYCKTKGTKSFHWNEIVKLFDHVLMKEDKVGGLLENQGIVYMDGLPRYIKDGYGHFG